MDIEVMLIFNLRCSVFYTNVLSLHAYGYIEHAIFGLFQKVDMREHNFFL